MDIGIEHHRHQQRAAGLTIPPDLLDHSTSVAYVTAAVHSPCSAHTTSVYSQSQQQQQKTRHCWASRCAICCTLLTSSIVFNLLVWTFVVVLVLRSSLKAVKEDEKQLNNCLHRMVCSEISTNWDAGNSSMHYSSQQQQQQQQHSHSLKHVLHAVNNRSFYVQQTGIYLVHSHLAFKPDRKKNSVIFEHEIRSKVRDSDSKCLVRDAQEKNTTHCVVGASCHTTLIVSTLFLRRDSHIYITAEPASLLTDPTNTAVFNITRLN